VRWTRRDLIRQAGLASASLALSRKALAHSMPPVAAATLNPQKLTPFVDRLPVPPVALSRLDAHGVRRVRITMREIAVSIHRDLPPTRQWSYGGSVPGPIIEARSGEELAVEWANALPTEHFLPIDHTLHGAERDKPHVRAVVHVQGARVGTASDGYPENWYVPGQSRVYQYPNRQDAAMLWYHDHAMGINRLNIYAGMFGLYIVRDKVEDALDLPRGKYELPLVLYDRMFDPHGQLYYPVSGDPESPWIPEFFGDVMLVNGMVAPYCEVEPRKYRLRLLNAANGRFFHLSMNGNGNAGRRSSGLPLHQIGSDQGLLPAPVELSSLLLAPAERADLIVDFSQVRGQNIILQSDTLQLVQFRVSSEKAADTSELPRTLRPVERIAESSAVESRMLELNEYDDAVKAPKLMLLNRRYWHMPVTEKPRLNTTEIWNLINLTEDTHPIHLHLVRFQILDRRPFDTFDYQTKNRLRFTGPAEPPPANEAGWKDTVQAYAGMVTRIIIRFAGYPGRYVWHCHILEHEAKDMMRPYDLLPA